MRVDAQTWDAFMRVWSQLGVEGVCAMTLEEHKEAHEKLIDHYWLDEGKEEESDS